MIRPRVILVFEPDESERTRLKAEVEQWGEFFQLRCWTTPGEFRAEVAPFLPRAALIILPDEG